MSNEQNHTETTAASGAGSKLSGLVSRGDYVLATKYGDGDPHDQWAIGFYDGITSPHYNPPRYNVVDAEGNQFRWNGFRRVKKISAERGKWLLDHKSDIESGSRSLWWWVRQSMTTANS